jgi:hypothetical protein
MQAFDEKRWKAGLEEAKQTGRSISCEVALRMRRNDIARERRSLSEARRLKYKQSSVPVLEKASATNIDTYNRHCSQYNQTCLVFKRGW